MNDKDAREIIEGLLYALNRIESMHAALKPHNRALEDALGAFRRAVKALDAEHPRKHEPGAAY